MDIDDKELFSSAMTDDSTPEVTEAPEAQPEQQDGRTRDDHGRFAARQSEPAPQPEPAAPDQGQAKDEANVPSWRLREVREEAERRVAEANAQWQRQFEMLQRQNQPKPEPTPVPEMFENPSGFVDHHLKQGLTPYEQRLQAAEERIQSQLERTSRRDAFSEHGEPTVRSAYEWLANGVRSRDPDVMHVYNRAMQSDHPYDMVTQAFKRVSIIQQIEAAGGADKWREQQLSAGQPQQQQGRQQSNGQPQGSITKLPPSLRNTPSARSGNDDDNSDTSDAALFRHAMR